MEFPDMPPISDDELQSMEDMELLRSQLRNVGDPVDATFAKLFVRSLEDKSLGVRKWQHRKSQFEKLLRIANSRAPADSQTPALEHPRLLSASGERNSGAAAYSADRARAQTEQDRRNKISEDAEEVARILGPTSSKGMHGKREPVVWRATCSLQSPAEHNSTPGWIWEGRPIPHLPQIPEQLPIPQLPQKTPRRCGRQPRCANPAALRTAAPPAACARAQQATAATAAQQATRFE